MAYDFEDDKSELGATLSRSLTISWSETRQQWKVYDPWFLCWCDDETELTPLILEQAKSPHGARRWLHPGWEPKPGMTRPDRDPSPGYEHKRGTTRKASTPRQDLTGLSTEELMKKLGLLG